jgi:hypothetical protein
MDVNRDAELLRKLLGDPMDKPALAMGVDYAALLLGMIDDFLAGTLSFEDFERRYSDCYIDELPEDGLSDEEHDFFGGIHEKFSWTDPDPGEEDRRYGWIIRAEFVEWLRGQRATHNANPAAS